MTTNDNQFLTLARQIFIIPVLLVFPLQLASASDQTAAGNAEEDPGGYLEFYSELDGKCQILSQGGKLHLVKNNHPEKKIYYRFTRLFSGKPQAGLVVGTAEPGNPIKLGCTRVDGREQSWKITVARFEE